MDVIMINPYNYVPSYLLSGAALIGTYCLILAYQKQHEIERVLTTGIKTTGTVVEIHQHYSGSGGEAPIVEYTTPNGFFRHVSVTYRMPCNYQIGQEVEIWYYHYKSIHLAALQDDKPGNLPKILLQWGIVLCLFSYPEVIRRMMLLF